MSKLDWVWQAGLWVLRVGTRPYRTGSWRKRAVWGLASTAIAASSAAGGYRYWQGSWWIPSALAERGAAAPNGPDTVPRRANDKEVVPLIVDDEQRQLEEDLTSTESAGFDSSRRNPATHTTYGSADDAADVERPYLPERPRFGPIRGGKIQPVSGEQGTKDGDETVQEAGSLPFRSRADYTDSIDSRSNLATDEPSSDEPIAGSVADEEESSADTSTDLEPELEVETQNITASESHANHPLNRGTRDKRTRFPEAPPSIAPADDVEAPPPKALPRPPSGSSGRSREASLERAAPTEDLASESLVAEPEAPRRLRADSSLPVGTRNIGRERLETSGSLRSPPRNPRPGSQPLEGAQKPSLTIEKSAPGQVQVGRPTDFQIKVRNIGTVAAQDVTVFDAIPEGVELVEMQPLAETQSDQQLVWRLGTLSPGEEAKIVMKVIPRIEGEIGSVADVTFRAQASVRTMSTKPIVQMRVDGPPSVLVGQIASINISITNVGTGAAEDLFLDAIIPEEFSHPAGHELQSPLGTLPPNGSKSITLPLKALKAGRCNLTLTATNEVNVVVDESLPIDVIAPDLDVSIQGPKVRYLDRQATYSVWISNPGTAPADEVEVVLFLSKGLKFVSANNQGQYDRQSHAVFWNLDRLPPDEKGDVQVVLVPDEMGPQKVRAEARDAAGLQRTDERVLQVEGLPELQFSVTDTEDPLDVGGETVYEVLILNKGSQAASQVRLAVDFPLELQPLRGSGTTAVQVNGQNAIGEPIARIAPGEKAIYKLTARGVRPGEPRIRVQLTSDDHRDPISIEERTIVHADGP